MVFFIAKIHRSQNQDVEKRKIPVTITLNEPLGNICFLFCWPTNFAYRVGITPAKRQKHSIEFESHISPGHFRLLVPLTQQSMGVTVLRQIIDKDYQWEIRFLFHNEGKKYYASSSGDPLGPSFGPTMPCN